MAPAFYAGTANVRQSLNDGIGRVLNHLICYLKDGVVGYQTRGSIHYGNEAPDKWRTSPSLRGAMQDGIFPALQTVAHAMHQLLGIALISFPKYDPSMCDELMDLARRAFIFSEINAEQQQDQQFPYCQSKQQDDLHPPESPPSQQHQNTIISPAILSSNTEASYEKITAFWNELDATGFTEDNGLRRPSTATLELWYREQKELNGLREKFEMTVMQLQWKSVPESVTDNSAKDVLEWQKQHKREKTKDQLWIKYLESPCNRTSAIACYEATSCRALQIKQTVIYEDEELVEERCKEYRNRLLRQRAFLSLSDVWLARSVEKKRKELIQKVTCDQNERIHQRLNESGLHWQARAYQIATHFDTAKSRALRSRLIATMTTFQPALFDILQLNPNNWIYTDRVNRYKSVAIDLNRPFWRWRYYGTMLLKDMIGGAYHFLVAGPFSFRALLCRQPYYAIETPRRDHDSYTSTWCSRLTSFYGDLQATRDNFERKPDTGIIGKDIQHLFLSLSHVLQRVVGTAAISVCMLFGTLFSSILCSVVLVGAPALATALVTVVMLFNIFLYDTALADAIDRGTRHVEYVTCDPGSFPSATSPIVKLVVVVPYNILVRGAYPAILASLCILILHPGIAVVQLIWTLTRYSLRSVRDMITWRIVRHNVRVPATDSYLARRIHGPGLSSETYYR